MFAEGGGCILSPCQNAAKLLEEEVENKYPSQTLLVLFRMPETGCFFRVGGE